ncbi:MAG TPA: AAA family ATPase, partial [Rhabdochlamydiaceae bacterium]|nr:AAA family ATPase [Rhabdochlamydiaceae bacterium]
MLEDLYEIHNEIMSTTPKSRKRYLYSKVNWESSGLCITGDRGVGKTTMICQDLVERYQTPSRALYISADHIKVLSLGLVNIAKHHFEMGGEALYIDEVHKYPNWSIEIKNILDTYKGRQIVFSASSSLDLNQSKGDLSRRVVYHKMQGFSFR